MAGGFIGYVYAPAVISNCVARGDVRSAASYYGGFVGRLAHDDATISGCWCSGAVWGTGGDIGSFIGHHVRGTNVNCAVSVYANGPRPFCGSDPAIAGGRLTQAEIKALSDGWPEAPKRAKSSAMIPISTPEELLAVTNNLSGSYVLTADIDFDGETIEPIGNYEFYGQNHKISNFYIDTTDKYAGLFGKINGGRVSGVQVEEGYVTGGPADSGLEDVGVGGLAGKIDSKSLVDGCWFVGEVWNTNSVNAGGFVGYTADAPVILRCCVESYVANESGKSYTGGFVGNHGGGFIAARVPNRQWIAATATAAMVATMSAASRAACRRRPESTPPGATATSRAMVGTIAARSSAWPVPVSSRVPTMRTPRTT